MDFSGMSLIKLKKEEMETQVQPWGGFSEAADEPGPTVGVPLSPARVPGCIFLGTGEGAGAGEAPGGGAGPSGRAEEAALRPGRGLRGRARGRGDAAGASTTTRDPQETSHSPETRPRAGGAGVRM